MIRDDESKDWYNSLNVAGVFIESLDPVLNHPGDQMRICDMCGPRAKLLHTQGMVAKVSLETEAADTPFTGLFSTGANIGLIRLSMAGKPDGD